MLKKLIVTQVDGSTHMLKLDPDTDAHDALAGLITEASWSSSDVSQDWVQAESGKWLRRDTIMSALVRSEKDFSLTEIMSLSYDDQTDFFSRNPPPEIHHGNQGSTD